MKKVSGKTSCPWENGKSIDIAVLEARNMRVVCNVNAVKIRGCCRT
jgi:hypothetical protein